MSNSRQDRLTVRVEVVVEGGRSTTIATPFAEGRAWYGHFITYPYSYSSNTPVVCQRSGVYYIEAWGESPSDHPLPAKVWAYAYQPAGVSTTAHPDPDPKAVWTKPTSTGHWSFHLSDNNPVPGAANPESASGGSNNSTLLVWWDDGNMIYNRDNRDFYSYNPGSIPECPTTMGCTYAVGSPHVPATLHATFTGALAKLGNVRLNWNGVSWVGESPLGGGCVLSLLGHGGAFQLMAAGPGAAFIVGGQPKVPPRFHWVAEGKAMGALSGPFGVTITE